ncbi:MAG: hypothetical protein JNM79_13385 [Burkholderiales bacterium]|nr:hypothetical protein [Burkholderiales bacterium]
MRKFLDYLTFLTSAGVLAFAPAVMAAADVGLVNQLQGDVSYQGGGAAAKASAFMKVRDGDRFVVPDGALLRVVYFDGGRQETWKGPASFKAGLKQGDATSGTPQVSQVPGGAPAKLAQTAEVIQIAKLGRAGGVTVRGVKGQQLSAAQAAEVAQARKLYESWRASAAPDDITPELYLYTVLDSQMLYEDMRVVVKTMQERAPNSQEVRELAAWVAGR